MISPPLMPYNLLTWSEFLRLFTVRELCFMRSPYGLRLYRRIILTSFPKCFLQWFVRWNDKSLSTRRDQDGTWLFCPNYGYSVLYLSWPGVSKMRFFSIDFYVQSCAWSDLTVYVYFIPSHSGKLCTVYIFSWLHKTTGIGCFTSKCNTVQLRIIYFTLSTLS